MTLTMKDLEARLDAQAGVLDALADRVDRLEGKPATPVVEDQEARDRALLSRHANSYAEAVAQQEARDRLEGKASDVDADGVESAGSGDPDASDATED